MMKRIAIGLVCPLIGALLLASCTKNDAISEQSSSVALLSFAIKDLKTQYTIKTDDGRDSTYTIVMSGSLVDFTIDQSNCLVYNIDSIAYGTNVSRVLVSVKADGAVGYVKSDNTLGSVEDSIDFTNPVTFRITSYDKRFERDYKVDINVHQVDPKKSVWEKIEDTNFPVWNTLKTFVKGEQLVVIGTDNEGVYHTASATLPEVSSWTTMPCSSIEGAGLSALLVDETFYLKTSAGLYRSNDASEWIMVEDETVSILPTDTVDISRGVTLFRQPLSTNPNIMRTIFVATPEVADTCAQVWTKLDSDKKWVEIGSSGNNVYGCPNLENLAVIEYADRMYAFGGKSIGDRKKPLEAFSACYESRDHGVTWKVNEESLSLPKEFAGYGTESFSSATDGEYVWVMWSNGDVWRGRWNGVK